MKKTLAIVVLCFGLASFASAQSACNSQYQSCIPCPPPSYADYTVGAALVYLEWFLANASFYDLIWMAL